MIKLAVAGESAFAVMIGFSERRQCMITAAANSEKLLTRLITDALTKMRRSRGRFWVVDGAFSMQKKRAATHLFGVYARKTPQSD